MERNIKIVEELPNGNFIIEITTLFERPTLYDTAQKRKKKVKFALADNDNLLPLLDMDGNNTGIQFFDTYQVDNMGNIIIGVFKDGREYYERVLKYYDLSDTTVQVTETPGGFFDIGPYAKTYCSIKNPTKTLDDVVPSKYEFNYGLINSQGILTIYPAFDDMHFGTEDTCVVALLNGSLGLRYGFSEMSTGTSLTPVAFEGFRHFKENRAVVMHRGKYGYLDRNKIMTNANDASQYAESLDPTFYRASDFEDGEASVCVSKGTIHTRPMYFKVDLNGNRRAMRNPQKVYMKKTNNQ